MESLIGYFETIPSTHRALILACGIAFFWLLEGISPRFSMSYCKWKHALINIFFTVTTIVVNFAMAFLLLLAANSTQETGFGLLILLDGNIWLQMIAGLLLLDLIGAYLAHYVQHKVPFLWRFHLIHHTDAFVDATTANRHHPGESIIRFLFTVLAVLIAGAPMWLIFLYQSVSVLLSQFNHANLSMNKTIDNGLKLALVTPDMHKVHHHYKMPYTDSNYGNIFSIWDRIFNTYRTLDHKELIYGVDTHMDQKHNRIVQNLLLIPFRQKAAKAEKNKSQPFKSD